VRRGDLVARRLVLVRLVGLLRALVPRDVELFLALVLFVLAVLPPAALLRLPVVLLADFLFWPDDVRLPVVLLVDRERAVVVVFFVLLLELAVFVRRLAIVFPPRQRDCRKPLAVSPAATRQNPAGSMLRICVDQPGLVA
jgi:hypothetical protein